MNTTNSLIDYTSTSETSNLAEVLSDIEIPSVKAEGSKTFKYNNSTRTPIIQRSKNNLKKKKSQKLARRLNRNK